MRRIDLNPKREASRKKTLARPQQTELLGKVLGICAQDLGEREGKSDASGGAPKKKKKTHRQNKKQNPTIKLLRRETQWERGKTRPPTK